MFRSVSVPVMVAEPGPPLQAQLAMGAETNQIQRPGIGLPIDEHEIRPDVAIPMVPPVAGQCMVAMLRWQRHVRREERNHRQEIPIERRSMPRSPV
jgi:hypothetical protein